MSFFVMISTPNNGITPLVDDENNVMLFDTEVEAIEAISENELSLTYGHEIYEYCNP